MTEDVRTTIRAGRSRRETDSPLWHADTRSQRTPHGRSTRALCGAALMIQSDRPFSSLSGAQGDRYCEKCARLLIRSAVYR